jgi:hypothetical protein
MDAKTRARRADAACLMVEEAQAASNDIFSATGFARAHFSIVYQQVRCTNLAWALGLTKKIGRGHVEKRKRLLHRFLDQGHR